MLTRRLTNLVLSVMVVASMLIGATNQTLVSAQTPTPPSLMGPYHIEGKVTPADREAAAKNYAALGAKPGLASEVKPNLAMDPNNPPHFFGPFANYANSPMPKGAVALIELTDGGSGYTDAAPPVVTITDVYGTGSGAVATATVVGGAVTAISIDNGGVSYSAPWVNIDDTAPGSAGTGAGAAATVTIGGPFDAGSGIRKFIDALPGLTPDGANLLNQYIPIAQADVDSFPGDPTANPVVPAADYYEIAVVQFTEKMHTDLPATTLRGYVQLWTSAFPLVTPVPLLYPDGSPILLPNGETALGMDSPHYLGPFIIAHEDRPVRIKFYNLLPKDAGGNLFIPVDTTYMGAGEGTLDDMGMPCDPMMGMMDCAVYKQNRSTIHLHGGFTAWISDGTAHQWTTPAGEDTVYPKGVSTAYVPDMWYDATGNNIPSCFQQTTCAVPGASNDPGDGSMTFYYNNQQSARLMFYHDHSYGITRLNVYAGEVSAYLLTDEIEQDLINGTNNSGVNPGLVQVLPGLGIPLIIQDKTFIDETTIAGQDPTWRWGTGAIDPLTGWPAPKTGDLWASSVYMPAQNPWDVSGASAFGRWMYGPWFWPPTNDIMNGPVPNPYFDPNCDPATTWCEPPLQPGTPSPSSGMEAFNDTMLVNGTVYPYLEVDPTLVRFRILNGANDRFVNLSLFVADPYVVTSDGRTDTEVTMVPAITTAGFPATWPSDGREGGVPSPFTAGPSWIQIGTEGGFLPSPAVTPPQPVTWNLNPTTFNFGTVENHSLLLGNAERADVLVDFSQYAGQTLILYNDAPAAFPALAPYYDYYTGAPARMDSGGAPTTQPGYGPNIRTVMQIRVRGNPAGSTVANVQVLSGGSDYSVAPEVVFASATGTGAAASAYGSIDHMTVLNPGLGYTTAPAVVIDPPALPGGVQAVATAQIVNQRVVSLLVSNRGSGYAVAPVISLVGGGGSGATAVAALTITDIQVTNPGSGYVNPPLVSLIGGAGYGATAVAHLVAPGPGYDLTNLNNLWTKDSVNPDATINPGVFALGQDPVIIAQAAYNSAYNGTVPDNMAQYVQLNDVVKNFYNGPLSGLTVTSGGSGYTSAPTVTISGGGGSGATATATIVGAISNNITMTARGIGYTSPPTVTLVGGGGTGATATAVLTRFVNTINMANLGNNYTSPPTVTITSVNGLGSGATAVANLTGGRVTSITVTNGGSGYNLSPSVTITGGGGTGARAVATLGRGVNSVLLTNGGSGYSSAPTVVFTGGGGSGAAATASILAGYVSQLTLTNPGAGYYSAPTITFDNTGTNGSGAAAVADAISIEMEPKAIHDEMGAAYDEFGRMSGFLGLEKRNTNNLVQNILLYGFASPPVDILKDSTMTRLGELGDGTQIWQIIHAGVDTHPIHFHLVNVQLINRIAWDGALLVPDANELGWKETVRVNPLEITVVAMRPTAPTQPFDIPNSTRLLDPTMPEGEPLMVPPGGYMDPAGHPVSPVLNLRTNFGWEYLWHCHILSHEEMDMMHSLTLAVAPKAPSNVTLVREGTTTSQRVIVSWLDNSTTETGFSVQRSTTPDTGPWVTFNAPAGAGSGTTQSYTDTTVARTTTYYYRVTADNLVGDTQMFAAPAIGFPTVTASSDPVSAAAPVTTLAPQQDGAVFADSFESGLDQWTGQAGNLQTRVEAVVGPNGGELGLVTTIDSVNPQASYVYDSSPDNLGMYSANFYFDSNGVITGETPIDIFTGLDQDGQPTLGVQYQSLDGITFQLRAWVVQNGEQVATKWTIFTTDEPEDPVVTTHKIDIAWMSGTEAGFSLFLDNAFVQTLFGDTSASKLSQILLGPAMGLDTTASGTMYFDEFTSSAVDGVQVDLKFYLPMIGR